jgi:gamma-glutamylcyclotransferase (GGCT)/AIG2-like uncharacterized protein YtfP
VHYFAYASNLDVARMRERCPGGVVVGLAELHDHELTFPRFSQRWGGGGASVQPRHGRVVYGILYRVSEADLAALDQQEGFRGPGDQHNEYDREPVNVELVRPDDDSIPRRVRAWVYVARPANPAPPSRRYLDLIVNAARGHRLPEEYVDALSATAADESAT